MNMKDFVATWWPLALPLLAVGASTVRADAMIASQADRVEYLYQKGSPVVSERLARIEERQIAAQETLARIERRIEEERQRDGDR